MKLEKNATLFIDEHRTNYGITLVNISLALTAVDEFGPKTKRIVLEGQWYEHKDLNDVPTGKKTVIALRIVTRGIYLNPKHDDQFDMELKLMEMYKKFCAKNEDIVGLVECEKDRFILFLNRSFKVNQVYNNDHFCEVGLGHKRLS